MLRKNFPKGARTNKQTKCAHAAWASYDTPCFFLLNYFCGVLWSLFSQHQGTVARVLQIKENELCREHRNHKKRKCLCIALCITVIPESVLMNKQTKYVTWWCTAVVIYVSVHRPDSDFLFHKTLQWNLHRFLITMLVMWQSFFYLSTCKYIIIPLFTLLYRIIKAMMVLSIHDIVQQLTKVDTKLGVNVIKL